MAGEAMGSAIPRRRLRRSDLVKTNRRDLAGSFEHLETAPR